MGDYVVSAERLVALAASLVLVVGAVGAARSSRAKLGSFVDPLGVFLSAWAISLFIFSIPWIRYTHSSVSAWIAVYGSIASFLVGCLLAYRITRIPERSSPEQVKERALIILWLVTLALGLVGFFAYLHAVDAVLGWRAVFSNPAAVRAIQTTSETFKTTYGLWKLLTYFNLASFLLWSIALRSGAFRGRRLVFIPLGLLAVFPFFFTADRTLLLTLITWTVIFHLVWRPLNDPRRILVIVLVVGIAVVGAFLALANRVDKKIQTHPEVATRLTTQHLREFALLYVYITSEIPTLSQLMSDPNRPKTDGGMTFLPAVKLAHAAGVAGTPPEEVGAYYPIPFQTFNLYSWLGSFYLDYGLTGCLVLPGVVGLVFTLLGIWGIRRRTLLGVWLLSLAVFVVAWTPFHNKISTTLTWELLGLGILIVPVLRARSAHGGVTRELTVRGFVRRAPIALSLVILGLTVLVAIGIGLAVASTQRRLPEGDVTVVLRDELKQAAHKAQRAYRAEGYPSSAALASQLHASDPRFVFLPITSAEAMPGDPRTIGVFTTRKTVWMRTFTPRGTILELRQDKVGSIRGVHESVIPVRKNLMRDSGFELPRSRWFISQGRGARAEIDNAVAGTGKASLKMTGTGRTADRATVATQVIKTLPSSRVGSVYVLNLIVRIKHLLHPLPAELKFLYEDGSYEFFPTHLQMPAYANRRGPIAGKWMKLVAKGVARRKLTAVQVFAVDTGTARTLQGSQWIDDVTLHARPFTVNGN